MTFLLSMTFGLGVILVFSAAEDIPMADTISKILSGQIGASTAPTGSTPFTPSTGSTSTTGTTGR